MIWKESGETSVNGGKEKEIVKVSKFIQQSIVNPPGGANVGEWCKKEKCWKEIRDYKYEISTEFANE